MTKIAIIITIIGASKHSSNLMPISISSGICDQKESFIRHKYNVKWKIILANANHGLASLGHKV